jgi:hypothetical protein
MPLLAAAVGNQADRCEDAVLLTSCVVRSPDAILMMRKK